MEREEIDRFIGKFVKIRWKISFTGELRTRRGILRYDAPFYHLHLNGGSHSIIRAEKIEWVRHVV